MRWKGIVGLWLFLFYWVPGPWAYAQSEIRRGNSAYQGGHYDQAVQFYRDALNKNPNSLAAEYNLGTALYKKEDFPEAIQHLQKAVLSDDQEIQKKVQFNLGNAFYKTGIAKEESNLIAAITDIEKSLGYYEKVLKNDSQDQDAKFNLDLVKKELERLKKKREEQEKKEQQQQNQNSQQQNKEAGQDDKSSPDNDSKQNSADQKINDNNENAKQQDQKNGNDKQTQDQPGSTNAQQNTPNVVQNQEEQSKDKSEQKPGEQQSPKPSDQEGAGKEGADKAEKSSVGQKDASNGAGQSGESSNGQDKGMMTPKEAQMFLDDYQRNEEPKGILYFVPSQGNKDKPVVKDW